MINIRYHIVSITAVFLALGIGVALGSTFLDRATVDVLDRNIRGAENRIKETNQENDQLTEELKRAKDRDTSLILVGSESLLADHLTDVPVLVIAAPGVDKRSIDALSTTLERTGADFRGTVQLSDKLAFSGDVDLGLASDLDVADPTEALLRERATGAIVDALREAGLPLNAAGLAADEAETTTTTTTTSIVATTTTPSGDGATTTTTVPADDGEPETAGEQPPAITALIERGYLKVDPGPHASDSDPILETTGYRYVYVGAPDLKPAQNDVLLSILPTSGAALPATVISASQAAPADDQVVVPTVVARVRSNDLLRDRYNTVDDSETFAGLVATVFTLQGMGEMTPGQYGQADGATAVLPPPA